MATHQTQSDPDFRLKAYEDKIVAQLQAAEAAAENGVTTARKTIERKLATLATTNEAQVVRAKADIDAAAAMLKAALDDFAHRLSAISTEIRGKER